MKIINNVDTFKRAPARAALWIGAATLVTAGVFGSGAAFAAAVDTTIYDEQSVELVVGASTELVHELNAVTGLTAGNMPGGTVVAEGRVFGSAVADSDSAAFSFVSGESSGTGAWLRDFIGTETGHKIKVIAKDGSGGTVLGAGSEHFRVLGDGAGNVSYRIELSGGQRVVADTYTIALTAYAWTL